ncbi:MAG: energy transducer TonB [Xanthomonadaceae bacterium]|jgi:protein TonB|nr:energy transducer TonB [Xanthomonadaceae bacterium]
MKIYRLPLLALPGAMAVLSIGCSNDIAPGQPSTTAPTEVMAVDTPPPDFPFEQACAGRGGQTLLSVVIGPTGKPTEVKLIRSSGHEALDQAALERIPSWQFRAATRNGQAISQTIQVPVNFVAPEIRPDECFKLDEEMKRDGN